MVFMIVNTNPVGLKISGGKHVEEVAYWDEKPILNREKAT